MSGDGNSVVPSVATATEAIHRPREHNGHGSGPPETNSPLIGEGHSTVQTVLTPEHPMPVKNLHDYETVRARRK